MTFKIYHNPRCRKSREVLQILQEKGIEPEIVLYLETPPSAAEIRELGEMMGKAPQEFIRKGETVYKEMVKGRDLDEKSIIEVMAKHPILIERPIVVKDGKEAVLGRPPEEVLKLL
jgi:arsenate reductase